jgi:hypothetical protein
MENDTSKLVVALQVIEPLALNRENAEKCINFDFVKKIGLILVNQKWATFDPETKQNQTLIRLVMRTMVPLINIKAGRDQFLQSLNPLSHLVHAIEKCKLNVEIIANGLRILRVLTTDPDILQRINKSYKDLANHTIQILPALLHNSEAKRELYTLIQRLLQSSANVDSVLPTNLHMIRTETLLFESLDPEIQHAINDRLAGTGRD